GNDVAQAVVGAAKIVDRNDMRVIQAGQNTGLGQKSLDLFRLRYPMAMRHLDSHHAPQVVVIALVDNPEASFAEFPRDAVTAQRSRLIRLLPMYRLRPRTHRLMRRIGFLPMWPKA